MMFYRASQYDYLSPQFSLVLFYSLQAETSRPYKIFPKDRGPLLIKNSTRKTPNNLYPKNYHLRPRHFTYSTMPMSLCLYGLHSDLDDDLMSGHGSGKKSICHKKRPHRSEVLKYGANDGI